MSAGYDGDGEDVDLGQGYRINDVGDGSGGPWAIHGTDSQVVEVTLQPGESAICEPGSMCYASNKVGAKIVTSNMLGSAFTNERILKPKYTNNGKEPGFVAFTPNFPAMVIPLNLRTYPEGFYVRRGMYFAQTGDGEDIRINAGMQPGMNPCSCKCCCSGFAMVMQVIEPGPEPGFAFLAASGTILQKDLAPGEMVVVSTGCVVGFSKTVSVDIRRNGGPCICLFSGEGLFSTTLTGPGKIILQSMPIDKLRAIFEKPSGATIRQGAKGEKGKKKGKTHG